MSDIDKDKIISGVSRRIKSPIYTYLKRHYCPHCGALLKVRESSRVINSKSDEAQNYNFLIGDIQVNGNVKFIFNEFYCEKCDTAISIEDMYRHDSTAKFKNSKRIKRNFMFVENKDNPLESHIRNNELYLPDEINDIDPLAINNYANIVSINVSEDNAKYQSQDGVLFDKEMKELICYPVGKKQALYSIPSNIIKISAWAFNSCKNIEKIVIPNSVDELGYGCFNNCINLNQVEIYGNIRLIDQYAFYGCKNFSIFLHTEQAPYLGYQALVLNQGVKIFVPISAKDAYLNHRQWKKFEYQMFFIGE